MQEPKQPTNDNAVIGLEDASVALYLFAKQKTETGLWLELSADYLMGGNQRSSTRSELGLLSDDFFATISSFPNCHMLLHKIETKADAALVVSKAHKMNLTALNSLIVDISSRHFVELNLLKRTSIFLKSNSNSEPD
jgi:hypothetical protein